MLFPTEDSTGVPTGWTPTSTEPAGLVVTTPGAVVEDVEIPAISTSGPTT